MAIGVLATSALANAVAAQDYTGTYRLSGTFNEQSAAVAYFKGWLGNTDPRVTSASLELTLSADGRVTGGEFQLKIEGSAEPDPAGIAFCALVEVTATSTAVESYGPYFELTGTTARITTNRSFKAFDLKPDDGQACVDQADTDYMTLVLHFVDEDSVAVCLEGVDDTTRTGCLAQALATLKREPIAASTPSPSPSPSSGPLSVALACSADIRNVNCTATPSGAGDGADLSYAWTFNGSPQAGTGSSFQIDFIEGQLDNGNYPVSVTLTDNNDGRTASASASVELGTFTSVAESNPNAIVLLLLLAGAGAAIIGAFWLWLRGRAPKPDFAALGSAPIAPIDPGSFAVGSDRAGGFEDSLEYGEGAGTATPASSKAYEALVVASSRQATADEPLVNPEGEVAETAREDAEDESRTRDRGVREAGEGR